MKIGNKGLNIIKTFEGCRLTAYKCPAGVWTIGYGHTAGVKQGDKITQQRADELLRNDMKIYESYVNKLNRTFNQNQFDALVSFCYNCGAGSLQTLCRNRNTQQIAQAILKYDKANGKSLPGLTRRRKMEQALFLEPSVTSKNALPYKVKTKCELNIREGAGTEFKIIRKAKKGEILTVWAIENKDNVKWGKNGKEYFCLSYCE